MKLIAMTLLIGMMTGAADAADIFDLHGTGAAEAAARVAAGQVPQVPPVFPAAPWNNNWPGSFPPPQHGSIDTCEFTADLGGKVNATRIWITASNPKFTGTEKISARLSNYYEAKPGSPESLKEASTQLLSFNGGSFQALAKFPDISLFESFHSWQNDFYQSLAVTVNGTNLQTGSGMKQFMFKMPGKPAYEAHPGAAATEETPLLLRKDEDGQETLDSKSSRIRITLS